MVHQEARERILRRFEAWLDESLAADPPGGIASEILEQVGAEEPPPFQDFYSMWSAITALTQEVRLQGRAFKQMGTSLDAVAGLRESADELRGIANVLRPLPRERERVIEREGANRALKSVIDSLLAVRDSLVRGLESARAGVAAAPEPTGLAKWFAADQIREAAKSGAAGIVAIERGCQLSLEKVDDALARMDVLEIRCQGEPFDPVSMNVIDLEETDSAPEGTVVATYRTGYRWRGEVHRTAQVKVARAPRREGAKP